MQLAVLAFYLDFQTLGLSQERMRGRTIGPGRVTVGQEKFITDLAEQFFGRVTGNFRGHAVGVKNPMVGAHQNDPLGEAFKDGSVEGLLALLARLQTGPRSFGSLTT